MKVVVVDEDVTLRSVVTRLAEAAGHVVLAETDSGEDAVELVTRFGAEVLVIDLSLPWGSGLRAIEKLREDGSACHVVVFTAHAGEREALRDADVRAVVEKPQFEELERVLVELARGIVRAAPLPHDRRRPAPDRPNLAPAVVTTPSKLEDPTSFAKVVDALEPDDAVVFVRLDAVPADADPWHELVDVDRFLAAGRLLRTVCRVQDRVSVDGRDLVAALLCGGRDAVESLWYRLAHAQRRDGLVGVLSAGWAVHDGTEPPYAAVARARDAAARSVGRPAGDRLWAG